MNCTSFGKCWAALLFFLLVLAPQAKAQNFATVSYPGAVQTGLYGINNHNVAVGYFNSATGNQAIMLSQGTFTKINVPSSPNTVAFGINDSGDIVGFYLDSISESFKGFLLSGGNYTTISFPGSVSTQARGINNSGQIVGIYQTADGKSHGFELVGGAYTSVDCPCGQTALQNISNSGVMVGYYIDASNAAHGLEYRSGAFSTLDFPGASFTYLTDINDSGTIVGTTSNTMGAQVGFKYANGQFSSLNPPPPYQNLDYAAINDSGLIVAEGDTFTSGFSSTGLFLSTGPFAYVGNAISPSGTLTVLDTQTNLIVTTIPNVSYAGVPFAASPDGTHIYLAAGNTVDVIDVATNSLIATVPGVGPNANAVTISPNGLFGYTANYSGSVGSVSVFSTATNSVVATVPVGFAAGGVTVTPDGAYLYVSGTGSTIAVINTGTNAVESTFSIYVPPVGYNSNYGPFLAPSGSFGYVSQVVASVTAGTVTAISIPSNQTLATIQVGRQPAAIAFSPDGRFAYVDNGGSNSVSVIDTASNHVIATIPVGKGAYTIAITPDGSSVYVGNLLDNTLSVIQTSTNSVVATIPMASPFGILIPSAPAASQSVTLPLSPTAPNQFNFGPHTFTVQYPSGTNFSGVDMTVTAAQTNQQSFSQRVATQFPKATCVVYSGAGGNCVDYQVTCSAVGGGTITCPSVTTPSITVKTSFDTQQQIINPGFLTTPIGTNDWTNIFYAFYLQRFDPTVQGRTKGFSEFVAVDLGATNDQGTATLQFLWPLRQEDARTFPAGFFIPAAFKLTSIANSEMPVTDAKAKASVQMVADASGNATSKSMLEEPCEIEHIGGLYFFFLDTRHYAAGTYVLTVYGNAFAAQQVQFTIKPHEHGEKDEW